MVSLFFPEGTFNLIDHFRVKILPQGAEQTSPYLSSTSLHKNSSSPAAGWLSTCTPWRTATSDWVLAYSLSSRQKDHQDTCGENSRLRKSADIQDFGNFDPREPCTRTGRILAMFLLHFIKGGGDLKKRKKEQIWWRKELVNQCEWSPLYFRHPKVNRKSQFRAGSWTPTIIYKCTVIFRIPSPEPDFHHLHSP